MSEVKYTTITFDISHDAAAGVLDDLSFLFPQGVDKTQRIGNKIKYKTLTVRFEIQLRALASAIQYDPQLVRVIICQQRAAFSGSPVPSEILDQPQSWNATIRPNTVRVMYDKTWPISITRSATQGSNNTGRIHKKVFFKLRNNVNFRNAAQTTATDLEDIYWICITTTALNATPAQFTVFASYFARMSFIDI